MNGEEKPVVVNASPVADQTGTATRDVLLIVSALPALIAVFGTRDVQKIVSFIGSVEFAPVLGILVGTAVMAWRQVIARRKKAELVTVAQGAPDTTAIVVNNGGTNA